MQKKVLVTRPIPEAGLRLLRARYAVTVLDPKQEGARDALVRHMRDCDGMIPLLPDRIDESLISGARKLKIIANYAVGYDNIDVAAARKYRIMVTNTPGVLTHATAEIAFALLITLTRRIPEADQFTRAGKFIGWDPMLLLGDELRGRCMGIIGMGRIGQEMARKCRAFGMKILYHNRNRLALEIEKELESIRCPLDQLLKQADAISVHAPLSPETRHLINVERLNQMKRGVYLINTARGELIDERALVRALQSGQVRGAGLDVYEAEPKITEELLTMKNVVLLPHIGSATTETRNRMAEVAARNVMAALEGKRPENLVPELKDLF